MQVYTCNGSNKKKKMLIHFLKPPETKYFLRPPRDARVKNDFFSIFETTDT